MMRQAMAAIFAHSDSGVNERSPARQRSPNGHRMVRLPCDLYVRKGQYRKETLIARLGGDLLMPTCATS
jgi:hypothetical protein